MNKPPMWSPEDMLPRNEFMMLKRRLGQLQTVAGIKTVHDAAAEGVPQDRAHAVHALEAIVAQADVFHAALCEGQKKLAETLQAHNFPREIPAGHTLEFTQMVLIAKKIHGLRTWAHRQIAEEMQLDLARQPTPEHVQCALEHCAQTRNIAVILMGLGRLDELVQQSEKIAEQKRRSEPQEQYAC